MRDWPWTTRARRLGIAAVCAAGAGLGAWNGLWAAMPWAAGR